MSDYYTECIPVASDEEEVLKLSPEIKVQELLDVKDEDDLLLSNVQHLIIEEDPVQSQLNTREQAVHLESVFKNQILYNSKKVTTILNDEDKRRKRLIKLKLLESEIKHLKFEIDSDKDAKDDILTKNVDQMMKEITSINDDVNNGGWIRYWKDKLLNVKLENKIESSNVQQDQNEFIIQNENSMADEKFVLNMDQRLGKIENVLQAITSATNTLSFEDAINDLYRRTNLILEFGSNAEEVENKIVILINKYEDIIKKVSRKDLSEVDIEQLLDANLANLKQKLQKKPQYGYLTPLVLTRLKNINGIVMKTAEAINFMNGLDSQLNAMELQMSSWSQKLDKLEQISNSRQEKFDKDKAEILAKLNIE